MDPILLPSFLKNTSTHLDQGQQNGKQTLCRLPLYVFRIILKDTSSIFIDSLRFCLSPSLCLSLSLSLKMLGKMFRFIVLRLENALVSQKN